MLRDGAFDGLCRELFGEFPKLPPSIVVAGRAWGEYADAERAFVEHGEDWDCRYLLTNRFSVGFVNDDAYRFLLPRLVNCSLRPEGLDADILDALISSLAGRVADFDRLFSPKQEHVLLRALQHLSGVVKETVGDRGPLLASMDRVTAALRRR